MKRYPSGLITADPVTLGSSSNGYIVSSTDQLQYNFSGVWPIAPLPPFPTYTSLSYSNSFDGSGDYLSIATNAAFGFGTDDFTAEAWIYPTSTSADRGIFDWRLDNTTNVNTNGTLYIDTTNGKLAYWNGTKYGSTGTTVSLNAWNHVAISRQSGTTRVFLNGVLDFSSAVAFNFGSTKPVGIGGNYSTGSSPFLGYISNLRFVKGTAVYTSAFTPPTAPLTAIANTSLLTCQSSTIIDNSSSPLTITVNGDTKALALSPFDTTLQTAYLAVAGGGGGGAQGGGGGAGGLLYRTNLILVPNVTYTITIGAGGTTSAGSSFGSDTRITNAGFAANITAIGGGAGQSRDYAVPGGVGGSGGGGGAGAAGGNATGQAGTPGQGNSGAPGGFPSGGGGGGGAGGAGNGGSPYAGNGGIGVYLTISGSNVAYAGGGGGGGVGGYNSGGGAGGIGGGGGGQNGLTGGGGFPGGTLSTTAAPGTYGPGAINTGGGGGGAIYLGGSGIVILASNIYQASNVTGNPNVTYDYGNSVAIYRFWQSGTIKW